MGTTRWPADRPERMLFGAWVVVGALFGFGTLHVLGSGAFLLVGGTLGLIVLLSVFGRRRAVLGVALGAATATGWLAWSYRHGPHWFCYTAEAQDCGRPGDPWPWLAVTVVLAGVGGYGLRRRGRRRRPPLSAVADHRR